MGRLQEELQAGGSTFLSFLPGPDGKWKEGFLSSWLCDREEGQGWCGQPRDGASTSFSLAFLTPPEICFSAHCKTNETKVSTTICKDAVLYFLPILLHFQ